MVAFAGGYYGAPFKGYQGLTQGYPMYPTILNLVVDMVAKHWIYLVVYGEAVPEGWGQDIQWWAMLFYADDGLIASTHPELIQG